MLSWRLCYTSSALVKVIIHLKINTRSSFSHPRVFPNLFFSVKHNTRHFLCCFLFIQCKSMGTEMVWLPTFYKISSFMFHRNSYRFRTTQGWVINNHYHFGLNYPFKIVWQIKICHVDNVLEYCNSYTNCKYSITNRQSNNKYIQ